MSLSEQFYQACETNNVSKVIRFIMNREELNFDVNFLYNGNTPLTVSVHKKLPDIYKILLDQQEVDINTKDAIGCTALHIACSTNNPDAIESIATRQDVNFNATTPIGDTPLMLAIIDGHVEAVSKMVNYNQVELEQLNYNDRLVFSRGSIVHNFLTILSIIEDAKQNRASRLLEVLTIDDEVREEEDIYPEREEEEDIEVITIGDDSDSFDRAGDGIKESVVTILHQVDDLRADIVATVAEYDERKDTLNDVLIKHQEETESMITRQLNEQRSMANRHKREMNQQKAQQNEEKAEAEYEKKKTMKYLENLQARLENLVSPTSSAPPCPSCPVCFESMKPPARILQCCNGHLVCESCRARPNVDVCPTCREMFAGRATAMEQHLRLLFKIE